MKLEKTHRLISVIKKGVFIWALLVLSVSAYISPGVPLGRVSDFADVIPEEIEQKLSETLNALDPSIAEIALVTVNNLGGDSVENFANELFREWGIGQQEKNNGVLFLISVEDRTMRIEVGYGLEGELTDLETFRIQEDIVKPYFVSGDYGTGIEQGIYAIIDGIEEELATEKKSVPNFDSLLTGFFLFLFGLQFVISILAPSKSWWLGGVIGGVVGGGFGLLYQSLIGALSLIVGLTLGGLILDYIVSVSYAERGKKRNDFWSRTGFGGFGGGGFGGGSSGGFGGGSSGGGGSSSSW